MRRGLPGAAQSAVQVQDAKCGARVQDPARVQGIGTRHPWLPVPSAGRGCETWGFGHRRLPVPSAERECTTRVRDPTRGRAARRTAQAPPVTGAECGARVRTESAERGTWGARCEARPRGETRARMPGDG
ncbi:hypothetical protein GCM10027176_08800 [Actinoallomurus bryophytorum]